MQNYCDWKDMAGAMAVIAHGVKRRKRGRRPSMPFGSMANPIAALSLAKLVIEVRSVIREIGYSPDSGIPLGQQIEKYEESMAPWPPPKKRKKTAEMVGEDPQYFLDIMSRELESIRAAKTLVNLQKHIVILNTNEFRLRRRPTFKEFGALVNDYRQIRLGTKDHWIGSKAKHQKVLDLLDVITGAMWQKYRELTVATA